MPNISDHLKVAAVFAESVRRELRHLPADTVADLTDGLESDIASSLLDGVKLVDPSEYAADLLRGAGLAVNEQLTSGRSTAVEIRKRILPKLAIAKNFTKGLAPAWWLVRAWVLTQVLGWVLNDRDDTRVLVGQWGEEKILGVVVFIAVLYLSVVLGRREEKKSHIRNLITLTVVVAGILLTTGQFQPGSTEYFNYSSPPVTLPCSLVPNFVGLSVMEMKNLQASGAITYAIDYYDKETMKDLTQTVWSQVATKFFRKMAIVEQENPSPTACASPVKLFVDEVTAETTAPLVKTPSTTPQPSSTTTSPVNNRANSTTSSVAKQVNKTTTSLSR